MLLSVTLFSKDIMIKRLEVFFAQASSPRLGITPVDNTGSTFAVTGNRILGPVYNRFFKVMMQNMLRLAFHKLIDSLYDYPF